MRPGKLMLSPFFTLAAVSPTRQQAFRVLVISHVLLLTMLLVMMLDEHNRHGAILLGQALLVIGIVEGALLVGWRLTQLPKSQALEFMLVSPVRPGQLFVAETLVGLVRLALVTLSGAPLLFLMAECGLILLTDVATLLLFPLIWGAATGLLLTAWAYESDFVRRWGERFLILNILLYLIVGVLAGENLRQWLTWLPNEASSWILRSFRFFHEYNPFGTMKFAMEQAPAWTWERLLWVGAAGLVAALVFLVRGACRLQGHFQDRHYRPVILHEDRPRPPVGDRPLAWWAVKRVSEYSGRINLWLAGGFGALYAIYTVAQDAWPSWLGRQAFAIFDDLGGIPMLTTALVILAGVPAAFQYGLWDSNAQDRCRRLELLLLTRLDSLAYWEAAAAAAWQRGKGYFLVALVLWSAGLLAGTVSLAQVLASVSAGVVLWALYFALGFRAFSRGQQANLLGLLLTLGLPLLAFLLYRAQYPALAALVPPGSVYAPTAFGSMSNWLLGPLAAGILTILIARWSLARCDSELRRWYDLHHGSKVMD